MPSARVQPKRKANGTGNVRQPPLGSPINPERPMPVRGSKGWWVELGGSRDTRSRVSEPDTANTPTKRTAEWDILAERLPGEKAERTASCRGKGLVVSFCSSRPCFPNDRIGVAALGRITDCHARSSQLFASPPPSERPRGGNQNRPIAYGGEGGRRRILSKQGASRIVLPFRPQFIQRSARVYSSAEGTAHMYDRAESPVRQSPVKHTAEVRGP